MHTTTVVKRLVIVFLGLSGCGGGTGTRKIATDASVTGNEGGSQVGPTTDSGGGTGGIGGAVDSQPFGGAAADVGDRIDADDVAAAPTEDAYVERIDAADVAAMPSEDADVERIDADDVCATATGDAPAGELSVEEVLAGADKFACALLNVAGKVFPDDRQKVGDWPAPALSVFILQDGGDLPGYVTSAPRPIIQLWSAIDLGPYLGKQVHLTAYLRSVVIEYPNGQSGSFLYLDVKTISTNEDVLQDAGTGPDVPGASDVASCQPLLYSGGTASFEASPYCPVDPSLPECKSQDRGAVVYRDEACAAATMKAHPDCSAWQRDLHSEVVILTDPFWGCNWPISVDSAFDCGDHVSVEYSVTEPCATCDGIAPLSVAIIIPNDPKPVWATATLKQPGSCP